MFKNIKIQNKFFIIILIIISLSLVSIFLLTNNKTVERNYFENAVSQLKNQELEEPSIPNEDKFNIFINENGKKTTTTTSSEDNVCESNNVVILTASSGALGFGHTTLLFERNNSWFYFSWQSKKVVFVQVPLTAMTSLDAFNLWVRKKDSLQRYIADYDSALLVRGDFSNSLIEAENIFLDYINSHNSLLYNSSLNKPDFSLLNNNYEYNVLLNNCVKISHNLLSLGVLNCTSSFNLGLDQISIISNIAKYQFESQLNTEEFMWIR